MNNPVLSGKIPPLSSTPFANGCENLDYRGSLMLPACDAEDTDNQNTTLLPGTDLLLADQAVSGHGRLV